MKTALWALGGFMGLPSDWNLFDFQNLQVSPIDSFKWNSLQDWAKEFNSRVRAEENTRSFLMGYSLGGRLALHALLQNPSQWQGAIIVSAHPGLGNRSEKIERQKIDENWAKRFEQDDWRELMNSWNQRTIFTSGCFDFNREEHHYDRAHLAQTLRQASLSKQKDLRIAIAQLPVPILWIAGDLDETYKHLALSIKLRHPLSQKMIIENAGHRLPWEQPAKFRRIVHSALQLF